VDHQTGVFFKESIAFHPEPKYRQDNVALYVSNKNLRARSTINSGPNTAQDFEDDMIYGFDVFIYF